MPKLNLNTLVFLLLLLGWQNLSFSRNTDIGQSVDSMERILPFMYGHKYLQLLDKLSEYCSERDFVRAKKYAGLLYESAKQMEDTAFMKRGMFRAALVAIFDGDFMASNEWFENLAKLSKLSGDVGFEAMSYIRIAQNLTRYGDQKAAMDYYTRAWNLHFESGSRYGQTMVLITLAADYYRLKLFHESSQIYELVNSVFLYKSSNVPKSQAYRYMAALLSMKGDSEGALKYARRAEQIFIKEGKRQRIHQLSRIFAQVYHNAGEKQKAIDYLISSGQQALEEGYLMEASYILNDLAHYYQEGGDELKAIAYQRRVLSLRSVTGFRSAIVFAYINYGDLLSKTGHYDSAQYYLEMGKTLADALKFRSEMARAIRKYGDHYQRTGHPEAALDNYELALQLENEESKAILDQQKQLLRFKAKSRDLIENVNNLSYKRKIQIRILVFFFGVLLLFGVVLWLFFRNKQRELSVKSLEIKHKLIVSQLNPSFIFNALVAIKRMINSGLNEESGKYLSGFARLIRVILVSPQVEFHLLSKETETMRSYFELQSIRFAGNLQYSINVNEELLSNQVVIPPFIPHPFLDSMLNRMSDQEGLPASVVLRINHDERYVYQECEISVPSISRSVIEQEDHDGELQKALKVISERIWILNRESGRMKIRMQTQTEEKNERYSVILILSIPLITLGGSGLIPKR